MILSDRSYLAAVEESAGVARPLHGLPGKARDVPDWASCAPAGPKPECVAARVVLLHVR